MTQHLDKKTLSFTKQILIRKSAVCASQIDRQNVITKFATVKGRKLNFLL